MKAILEVQSVSKKFLIQHQHVSYLSMRDKIVGLLKDRPDEEEFWALREVSFQVSAGDSIGIIGRNGAGKSTLLKILSRITPPTQGRIVMRGRIASLLEVGTGFHQELTGRENIFMNGSILGMKRAEITARFDEIVAFSGVEKFLDTPIKYYSSGMQLRLAFAVAAHLEPEILVVDEVLAVGDAEFQKKCIGKMEEVSKSGRTILFVSHNLDAIESLCKTSLFLSSGKLIEQGITTDIVRKYISSAEDLAFEPCDLGSTHRLDRFGFAERSIIAGASLRFELVITKRSSSAQLTDLCLLFYNYKKQRVAIYDLRPFFKSFKENGTTISFEGQINHFGLVEGTYYAGLYYGVDSVKNDLFDLAKIVVKRRAGDEAIKPYELQYRGFVELT